MHARKPLPDVVRRGVVAALGCGLALVLPASAQAGPSDTLPSSVAREGTPETSSQSAWMKRMAGSSAELGTYIGSGSFYTSGYHDNYVSTSLYLRPTFDLGTRFKLAASARLYLEEELTLPDDRNAHRFNPYDVWLSLVARDLHTFAAPQLVLGGLVRLILPLSRESHNAAHLAIGLAVGPTLSRVFEFGGDPAPERRFKLLLTYIELFTKYVRTSDFRGDAPGDSSGCRGYASPGSVAASADGPSVSASDRCGGPINASFALRHAAIVALSRGNLGVSVTLLVDNSFLYRVPPDAMTSPNAVDRGREDLTWGVVAITYSLTEHFALSVGLSSLQPALDAQSKDLRFPFFDFSGSNANNYTQAFVSLSATL